MKKLIFTLLMVLFFLSSCSQDRSYVRISRPPSSKTITLPKTTTGKIPGSYVVNGERYYPLPDSHGFVQYGKASWYGKQFQGRPTANGEIFDTYKKTAAHKTLPLGTYVKVLNQSNKKFIIVRINDRGPFVKGRIIDLSYAAGKEIDLIGPGVIDVKITALGKEVGRVSSKNGTPQPLVELKDLEKGEFTIQIGAFKDKVNASRLADRLRVIFDYINILKYVDKDSRALFRLHVSKSKTLTQAGKIEKELKDMGFTGAFIVRI